MALALRIGAVVLLALHCAAVHAQPDKPALPSVLIIGDQVYQQFAAGTAAEFKGRANVVISKWPAHLLLNSTTAIEQIDLLLGHKDTAGNDMRADKRPVWNLIHLNVGLGDLIYRAPGLKSHRNLPFDLGGVVTTTPEQYEKNLTTLIELIKHKAPSAKIVWASTTPIRSSQGNFFKPGSEVEYNRIAERVMRKHDVPINDLHAYAEGLLNREKPAAQDPFFFDGKPIHPPVVELIARELKLPLKQPAETPPTPKS